LTSSESTSIQGLATTALSTGDETEDSDLKSTTAVPSTAGETEDSDLKPTTAIPSGIDAETTVTEITNTQTEGEEMNGSSEEVLTATPIIDIVVSSSTMSSSTEDSSTQEIDTSTQKVSEMSTTSLFGTDVSSVESVTASQAAGTKEPEATGEITNSATSTSTNTETESSNLPLTTEGLSMTEKTTSTPGAGDKLEGSDEKTTQKTPDSSTEISSTGITVNQEVSEDTEGSGENTSTMSSSFENESSSSSAPDSSAGASTQETQSGIQQVTEEMQVTTENPVGTEAEIFPENVSLSTEGPSTIKPTETTEVAYEIEGSGEKSTPSSIDSENATGIPSATESSFNKETTTKLESMNGSTASVLEETTEKGTVSSEIPDKESVTEGQKEGSGAEETNTILSTGLTGLQSNVDGTTESSVTPLATTDKLELEMTEAEKSEGSTGESITSVGTNEGIAVTKPPINIEVMVTTEKNENGITSTEKETLLTTASETLGVTSSVSNGGDTEGTTPVSASNSISEVSTDGEAGLETTVATVQTDITTSEPIPQKEELPMSTLQASQFTTVEPVTEQQTSKKPPRDFCIFKGMIIQNLADVPSKDDCELCQCVDGEIVCARRVCEDPPSASCIALPTEGSQCCPKYDCSQTSTESEIDIIKTTQTSSEVQEDDTDEAETEEEDQANEVTSSIPITTTPVEELVAIITSPKPIATTQLTTLLTTMISQEGAITTVTPAGIQQNANGTFGTASGDILSEEDYDELDLESLGPGACLFEGKIYVSAQQIPRDNPCDFCFCFRGDIICLQQSCPPPIPGCKEEIIPGFCCPRYECPVKMSFHNITRHVQHQPEEPPSLASWFGWGKKQAEQAEDEVYQTEVKGCEVQGEFYEAGALVDVSSGPCLQCRYSFFLYFPGSGFL